MKTSRLLLAAGTALLALALPALALLPQPGGDEIELDEAEAFIEWNSTDGDFGIQFFWDGDPWDKMGVFAPGERAVLRVAAKRNVAEQGLTEGFFESAEPSADELSMEEFFERFPEGEYEFEGYSLEGDELEGETDFTHVLPTPPTGLYPSDIAVNANAPLTATFDAVTMDIEGAPLTPVLYEVVIETETDDLERIFSIILPGDVASPAVTVPPEFLYSGGEYKLEIIVQEESGNRTIAESIFTTL